MTTFGAFRNWMFSRIVFCLAACALALSISITGCGGSSAKYSVSGKLTNGGAPLPGVEVALTGTSLKSTTDANGRYYFGDVEIGNYTVTPDATNYKFSPASRPVFLNGIDAENFDFTAVEQGRIFTKTHTLYLKGDGTVWAWGANNRGQLGNDSTTDSSTPVQVAGFPPATTAKAIAAGYEFSLALLSDGSVWAWGSNDYGKLGINDSAATGKNKPAQVQGLPTSAAVTAIAAGNDFAMALLSDGTVWTWGHNDHGQLGNSLPEDSLVPVQVTYLTSVSCIAAGGHHALALVTDHTVRSWGKNNHGQLGNGETTDSSSNVAAGVVAVTAVAAGEEHSFAIMRDGTVRAWGNNANGRLGLGSTTDVYTPAQPNIKSVAAIAAGYDHTLAVKSDGTVWAWGGNASGQLGDGSTTARLAPVQITSLTNMTGIAAGHQDSFGIKTDNSISVWGSNENGRLAIDPATTVPQTTPVIISTPW